MDLQKAVQLQLEKQDVYEIKNVTDKYFNEKTYTQQRLAEATLEAMRELGVKKIPTGDLLISAHLEQKNKPSSLGGKEV